MFHTREQSPDHGHAEMRANDSRRHTHVRTHVCPHTYTRVHVLPLGHTHTHTHPRTPSVCRTVCGFGNDFTFLGFPERLLQWPLLTLRRPCVYIWALRGSFSLQKRDSRGHMFMATGHGGKPSGLELRGLYSSSCHATDRLCGLRQSLNQSGPQFPHLLGKGAA